jgi:hypothetical protein
MIRLRQLMRWLCCAHSAVALSLAAPLASADPPPAAKQPQPMIGVVGDVTYATDEEGLAYDTRKTRVLVIGGLDGSPESYAAHVAAWAQFHRQDLTAEEKKRRDGFTLTAATVNLPGVAKPKGAAAARIPLRGFPPKGQAYTDEATAPAHYLWRWIGMHAPDVVIEIRHSDRKQTILRCPVEADVKRFAEVAKPWLVEAMAESDELVPQLVRAGPAVGAAGRAAPGGPTTPQYSKK